MKKLLITALTVLLTLIMLTACGKKENNNTTSGESGTVNVGSGSETGSEDPTVPPVASGNPLAGSDLLTLIGKPGKLSDYNPEKQQSFINEAKAAGGNLEIKEDGSAIYTDKDGNIAIQNPDGFWEYKDADGKTVPIGANWPDNEFTKLIPKPDFAVNINSNLSYKFSMDMMTATPEQVKAYVEKLKESGFTDIIANQDEEDLFTFVAKNEAGYELLLSCKTDYKGIIINSP